MITSMNFKWNKRIVRERLEFFNYKNKDCQASFKELTSKSNNLSTHFDTIKDLDKATDRFLKELNTCIQKSFKKIRIKENTNGEINKLFEKRKELKSIDTDKAKKELDEIELKLTNMCAEQNRKLILDELNGLECESGGNSVGKLWSLRRKLFPKSRDPPTAMLDVYGNLLTSQEAIEEEAIKHTNNGWKIDR